LKFLSKISPKEVIIDMDIDPAIRNTITSYVRDFVKSYISLYTKPYDSCDFVKNVLKVSNLKAF
jgi:hypothetical protein